jgi:hypothetical protein
MNWKEERKNSKNSATFQRTDMFIHHRGTQAGEAAGLILRCPSKLLPLKETL